MPTDDFRIDTPRSVRRALQVLATKISNALPEGWGFALLVFTFEGHIGDPNQVAYVSNAQRQDMVKAMQEFLRRQGD